MTLVPAILAKTEEEYSEKLKKIASRPEFAHSWVQIDFIDNKFVQNQTIGTDIAVKYLTNLLLEAHLMVINPEEWIPQLVKTNVKRIILPVETDHLLEESIDHIKQMGLQAGLSINPETPVEKVWPFIDKIDAILVMGVHPGFGGQQFIPGTIDRVKAIKSWGSTNVKIGVDGGIDPRIARDLTLAGADYIVAGSHLLEGDIDENLRQFREAFRV